MSDHNLPLILDGDKVVGVGSAPALGQKRMSDDPKSCCADETRRDALLEAIRAYCRKVSPAAIQMSHGVERIYYSGLDIAGLVDAVVSAVERVPAAQTNESGNLVKLAAECHRAKWQFQVDEDCPPRTAVARQLVLRAFDELHRIGDLARRMYDEARSPPSPTPRLAQLEAFGRQVADQFDYARKILANNIERCQDVIWDLKNKPEFSKDDPNVLGVIAVCEQMETKFGGSNGGYVLMLPSNQEAPMTAGPTINRILAGNLPDIEAHDDNQNIRPHPDRRAWLKACPECAHRTSDPQQIGERYQQNMMKFDGGAVFYCLHRKTEDGFERICACYAATHRFAQIKRDQR